MPPFWDKEIDTPQKVLNLSGGVKWFYRKGLCCMEKKENGFSIAALVLGLIAIVGGFIPVVTYVAWAFGILGIVFGALGMKKAKTTGNGHGLSVAGLVLGIIGTVIGLTGFICIVICAAIAAA